MISSFGLSLRQRKLFTCLVKFISKKFYSNLIGDLVHILLDVVHFLLLSGRPAIESLHDERLNPHLNHTCHLEGLSVLFPRVCEPPPLPPAKTPLPRVHPPFPPLFSLVLAALVPSSELMFQHGNFGLVGKVTSSFSWSCLTRFTF